MKTLEMWPNKWSNWRHQWKRDDKLIWNKPLIKFFVATHPITNEYLTTFVELSWPTPTSAEVTVIHNYMFKQMNGLTEEKRLRAITIIFNCFDGCYASQNNYWLSHFCYSFIGSKHNFFDYVCLQILTISCTQFLSILRSDCAKKLSFSFIGEKNYFVYCYCSHHLVPLVI